MKTRDIKLHLNSNILDEGSNKNGEIGEVCNNCGGYGFTMNIKGGKLPCMHCKKTGVKELSNQELQKEVYNLKKDIQLLRRSLMNDLGFHGRDIPGDIRRANHAQ
jgi:hypothetical protein